MYTERGDGCCCSLLLTSRGAEDYDVIRWWSKCTLGFPSIGTSFVTYYILVGLTISSQREIIEKAAVFDLQVLFGAVEQAQ